MTTTYAETVKPLTVASHNGAAACYVCLNDDSPEHTVALSWNDGVEEGMIAIHPSCLQKLAKEV